jgi:hypothetical protein
VKLADSRQEYNGKCVGNPNLVQVGALVTPILALAILRIT